MTPPLGGYTTFPLQILQVIKPKIERTLGAKLGQFCLVEMCYTVIPQIFLKQPLIPLVLNMSNIKNMCELSL